MDEVEAKSSAEKKKPPIIGQDLELAMKGDPEAFDRLVRPLLGSLLALAKRLAPPGYGEELLQECLIRAHRGLFGFRGGSSFRSWIVAILFNLARDPRKFLGPQVISRPLIGEVPPGVGS